jgi:ubiquinone/menaquinone biosynthesis C-methylase UbiE
MSMPSSSKSYFERVAGEWDSLRAGYFSEAVRAAAIHKAYLRPEYVVADVGAGSGFISAGLAPLVSRVHVLDGSPAMLEQARFNLGMCDNLQFQEADGLALPLPDASMDAVFANMYLHHCPDPLAALSEIVRTLRPGGRLIITDLDEHPYEWLKSEMADVWQGFSRRQIREWFQTAGLVNIIVDCTGEDCCASSLNPELHDPETGQAKISTFVAVGTRRVTGMKEAVQMDYGLTAAQGSACCTGSSATMAGACCGTEQIIPLEIIQDPQFLANYQPEDLAQAPQEAVEISLGCGNPLALAELQSGEVVLDIGSGGGIDVFLAARRVGATGKVIGVDMTPGMLERARRTAARAGLEQVEFRQGQAEALPVEDNTMDVVISNCVINLCEDKGQVFQEAYRVLKPGGRLEVSDVATDTAFPQDVAYNASSWAECVAGALPLQEYLDLVSQAGFREVTIRQRTNSGSVAGVSVYSVTLSARK